MYTDEIGFRKRDIQKRIIVETEISSVNINIKIIYGISQLWEKSIKRVS
jgi:hypothetical protein